MGKFKYFPSPFSPSLAQFFSSIYLIGPLSKPHTLMFAKALLNSKELIIVKGIICSKEQCKIVRNYANGIYHSMSVLQGGYHHHFQFPDKETKAQDK